MYKDRRSVACKDVRAAHLLLFRRCILSSVFQIHTICNSSLWSQINSLIYHHRPPSFAVVSHHVSQLPLVIFSFTVKLVLLPESAATAGEVHSCRKAQL